jgi:replicative DNA helicase
MKVTIFQNLYKKEERDAHYMQISEALRRIQEGKSATTIEAIRNGAKDFKKNLPVVLFSGEFKGRYDEALERHSQYIVLDFDHIDVAASKALLSTDPYVYSCWVSPSGDGLKALVKVTNPERHRDHFRALRTYFHKQYDLEVDESGINESRACFESYDPDIVINDDSSTFGAFATEKSESQIAVSKSDSYTDYLKLNLATRMIRQAADGEKHPTLLRAARLCGGYISAGRMEEDEVIRILTREIMKRDIDDEQHAVRTIKEAIEKGKQDPIRATIDDERKAQRELLINDGDMSFISSDDEDFRWIDDYANGKIPVGLDTGDPELDKYFRYKKEFTIVNGHSNVGKTTMALYLMVNATIRHKWKWVVYSSENRTASLKMSLIQFAMNKPVSSMNHMERKRAYEWVGKYFTVISNKQVYSYSDIIVFLEKIMKQQDVDAVFVDPYNSLKIDMGNSSIGVHDYHYEAASEFLTFSTANNVAVWLNMHAVTEAQRRKGEDGLPVAPYAEDTEGGGKFVNRADCFITIHRKVQHPIPADRKITELHVRKVRDVETGGEPTPLEDPIRFEMNTSRTAFRVWKTQDELFQSVDLQGGEQDHFMFNLNT